MSSRKVLTPRTWIGLWMPALTLWLLVAGCRVPQVAQKMNGAELPDSPAQNTSAPNAVIRSPLKRVAVGSPKNSQGVRAVNFQEEDTLDPPPAETLPPATPLDNPRPKPLAKPQPSAPQFPPIPFDTTLPPALHQPRTPRSPLPDQYDADPDSAAEAVEPLQLDQVTQSIVYAFPALEAAAREREIADGKQLATWGEFDLKLKAESISTPLGFYQNYRNGVKVEQGLWPGGSVYGQYRIGDGNFPVWYGDRQTNEGGEFKVGVIQPLLRDRAIDQRRADIFQATLRRQQVEPAVQAQLLEFVYAGADAYWSWVAAGQAYDVQRELLRVTIQRNKIYEARVKAQDLPQIELIQNERLIASREAKMIEAQRKLQQSTIKLSLFLRDDAGQPLQPPASQLPEEFPEAIRPDASSLEQDIALAYTARPEIRELSLIRQQAEIDLAFGQNLLLPGLNAAVAASKDVGAPSSVKGDKTPFEMEAGLYFDVPMQRRKGVGKIREAEGKLAQLGAKRQFTENKIKLQLQDTMSAMVTSYDRWQRAHESMQLARQLETAERARFEVQDSDLLRVALQESAAIEAALLEIEALSDFFKAQAAYRAAMAADPIVPPAAR